MSAVPPVNDYGGMIRYVTVTAIHYINGLCCPQIVGTDAGEFLVEEVLKRQELSGRGSTFGAQERYLVKLKGRERYLYRNGPAWFLIPQRGEELLKEKEDNEWECW